MSYSNLGNYDQYRWQYRRYYSWLSGGSSQSMLGYMNEKDTNKEVSFERPELREVMIKYILIRDCLLGESNIKDKGDIYLPRPSDEISEEEETRYQKYLSRATFLNATGLTQRTIVGKLLSKPPSIELPAPMDKLRDNVNGEGLSIHQMIEQALAETFAMGRCGLYADFRARDTSATPSIADIEDLSPTITFVKAENIINWRLDKNRKKVTMIVVREFYETYEKFAVNRLPQFRVFMLDESDQLTVTIYRANEKELMDQMLDKRVMEEVKYSPYATYQPLMANGQRWNVIPFSLIGSTDNDWTVDEPPLYQIATYDVALYRNSADIEEAAFYVGQPTPYVAGITQQWADDMGIRRMKYGSGRFLPLQDPNAKVGLVQANPDTMLDKLIDYKMAILRHLGATVFSTEKLAEDQTATGAIYQALQIHAPLVTTSRNVVEAFSKVLEYAGMFVSESLSADDLEVKLNSEILDNPLGVTGLQITLELYKNGIITFDEAREQVRVQGLALHTPEEAKAMIEEDPPADLKAKLEPKPMPMPMADPAVQPPQNNNTTNVQQEMNNEQS